MGVEVDVTVGVRDSLTLGVSVSEGVGVDVDVTVVVRDTLELGVLVSDSVGDAVLE